MSERGYAGSTLNLARAWDAFWFRPISARPLGVYRIVMGVLTLCFLGFLWVDLDHWLTDAGLMVGDEARWIAGPLRPSPLQWVQDPVSVRLFMAATAVVATLFTLGWRTRVMSVLLYLGVLSIHHRNIPTNCGPDNLLVAMLFYLMLAPSGAAYSLDAQRDRRRRRLKGEPPAEPMIAPWAVRLLQLQLSLIYLNTAVYKCNGSTWLGGTALHFVLHNPEVGRLDLSALGQYPLLINVLTLGGVFVEFALAFLLWNRATRAATAWLGVMLHAGILPLVNVPLFGELMTAAYLVFLDADQLDALLRALNPTRWVGRRRSSDDPSALVSPVPESGSGSEPAAVALGI
jgi:hypothetical protein